MTGNEDQSWWEDNSIYIEDRLFEYTSSEIKEQYKNNLDKLKDFPCLFTYESQGSGKVKGYIGFIQSIQQEKDFRNNTKITIKYLLDKKYPTISINTKKTSSDLLDLGITKSFELKRTHWAIKDKDLFLFLSNYLVRTTKRDLIPKTNEMKNIWGENYINRTRIFFSHKANYKTKISNIKTKLEKENFSCFIAHEDIKPTLEWQKEIIKALDTMHIFIGIVTDDFHKGSWTDQEIGYAYKREIPRVFIKIDNTDPQGFVSSEQALTTNWDNAHEKIIEHLKKNQEMKE